ncbi:ABC transporter permease subunit [Escherichia coli]|uniref:ABC transporter permease subunit n=1 Tax=Escherichia coli TaxID=562 RepID=UPI0030CCCAEB
MNSVDFLSVSIKCKNNSNCCLCLGRGTVFYATIAGALTNISRDLYEASEVDGATKWQQFKEITLPMVLHQVAPTLVMTFAYNFNNFGAIYLLTEGNPTNSEYRFAGHTDIFIS